MRWTDSYGSQSSWIKFNITLKYIAIMKVSLFLSISNAKDRTVPCPMVSPDQGVFAASQINKGAIVAIEEGDDKYPINLVLYDSADGVCPKKVVAKHPIEGAAPKVDSLFFAKIGGRVNLFVIVHWELRHSGIGTYENLYQVYAYERGSNGYFAENKNIIENSDMTGIDGYVEHRPSTFRLKTARDVKNFLRQMR